jgi:hydrogenase nickel incorporation protein HypA/HybF
MHELSLAQSVIEIAEAEAKKHNATAVKTVKLRLGEFTGVVREALEFGFEIARRGTAAETAVLEIETVPLKTKCPKCETVGRQIEDFCLICPKCGVPVDVLSGREMQIDFIDLAEAGDLCESEAPAGCGMK